MSNFALPPSRPHSPSSPVAPTYFRRPDSSRPPSPAPPYIPSAPCPSNSTRRRHQGSSCSEYKENDGNRVLYGPIPEKRKLGYMSIAAMIVNKMIGTGIFSQPSTVLKMAGSKGAALVLWILGSVMTASGLFVYLEFGIAFPVNGGEMIYLDESYPIPRYFATCIYGIFFILLGNTAANGIAFAKYMLVAFSPETPNPDPRLQKFVAVVCLTFVCLIHLFSRKMGIMINNVLAVYKVLLLSFVVVAGFACMAGARVDEGGEAPGYGLNNLKDMFKGYQPRGPHDYATAMLGVLYSFQGWENANYVLAEVKRPKGNEAKTFKRAILIAFAVVSLLYILANVAYFAASTTEEIMDEGVIVAANFFIKVFGTSQLVTRGLKVLIAFSAFGNLVAVTYANSRVKQEIAKKRILPWSKYWARNSPYGTPVGALTLHWIFTVVVVVATPAAGYDSNDEAYDLVSVLFTYGHTWVGIFVSIGILTLHRHPKFEKYKPAILSKRLLRFIAIFWIVLNSFVIGLIWWPVAATPDDTIPWFITPAVATSIIVFGIIYWVVFAKVLPALGWKVERKEEMLVDGSMAVWYKRSTDAEGWTRGVEEWWRRYRRREKRRESDGVELAVHVF
ncbi:hypothetical protein RUND412_009973 [Rhizina undulata]